MAPFTLINIPTLSLTDIHQDRALGFCFAAFRCTSYPDPYEAFASTMNDPTFKAYFNILPKELRNLVLAYLGKCIDHSKHTLGNLVDLVAGSKTEKEEIMTSIAQAIGQEYEKKGMQQGMQQGMQRRNIEIAKNMLSKLHLDMQTVSKATGLSQEELMKLQEEGQEKS
jgi:hypothetical protein